jgi:hypothetical protein
MSAERFSPSMNGYRVIQDGKRGALVRCFSRTKRAYYWRVKFDAGADGVVEWAWPGRLIAESAGPCLGRCVECEWLYWGETPQSGGLCPNCAHAQRARERPDHDPDAEPSHQFGRARRRHRWENS